MSDYMVMMPTHVEAGEVLRIEMPRALQVKIPFGWQEDAEAGDESTIVLYHIADGTEAATTVVVECKTP